MSVMTDFVIADPPDAQRVCDSNPSEPVFEWLETRGVDTHQVGVLLAAAFDRPFDPSAPLPRGLLRSLAFGGEDGPAVYGVSPELVERLASLDLLGTRGVVERWAGSQDQIGADAAAALVPMLSDFCRRARAQGKGVLLSVAL